MGYRFAEKDESDKEQEEAERLVKRSPDDKPPRRDKERRVMEVGGVGQDDPDLNEDDPDLSMRDRNAIRSAVRRYIYGDVDESTLDFSTQPDLPEQSARARFAEEGDGSEDEGSSSEDGGSDDAQDEATDENEPSGDGDEDDSSESEENGSDGEEEGESDGEGQDEEDLADALVDEITNEDTDDPRDPKELALQYYQKDMAELEEVQSSEFSSPVEAQAVEQAVEWKQQPLPPQWSWDRYFERGVLTLEGRKRLRQHVRQWGQSTFVDNLETLKERRFQTYLEGDSEMKEKYWNAVIKVLESYHRDHLEDVEAVSSWTQLLPSDLRQDKEFDETDQSRLQRHVQTWHRRLKKNTVSELEAMRRKVKRALEQSSHELSQRYAWLSTLKSVLQGELTMRQSDASEESSESKEGQRLASALREGMHQRHRRSKESVYRGLPGPLDRDDPHRPDQPDWARLDTLELTIHDYVCLLRHAARWYDKASISSYPAGLTPHREALDYAIQTARDGAYDGRLSASTYHDLLELFSRIYPG